MKRIISLIIAALMLMSAASCAQIPEDTKPDKTKEKEPEVTYEEFKGETGNYSGAKFASLADLSAEAVNAVKNDCNGRMVEYCEHGERLAVFYDSLYEKLLSGEKSGVVSPVNIYMSLSLLAECTDGNSRKQILDVIGVSNIE